MKKLTVATHKQTSFMNEKETYYVAIGEGAERIVMNIGKTSYEGIQRLIEGPVTNIKIDKPIEEKHSIEETFIETKGGKITAEKMKGGK